MTGEQRRRSGNGPKLVTFAQFEVARESKAAGQIEARFRGVLDDLENTIEVLDDLPRTIALEPDREKLVVTCIAARREISRLRTRSLGDGLRFAQICEDLSARFAAFRRRFEVSEPVTP